MCLLDIQHQKTVAWLEWMVDLPWSKSTEKGSEPSITRARERLDEDHYGSYTMPCCARTACIVSMRKLATVFGKGR